MIRKQLFYITSAVFSVALLMVFFTIISAGKGSENQPEFIEVSVPSINNSIAQATISNAVISPGQKTNLPKENRPLTDEISDLDTLDRQALGAISMANELYTDFFTTEFGIGHQHKWQEKLYENNLFLSTFSRHLHLDKLFGMELNWDENKKINTAFFDAYIESKNEQDGSISINQLYFIKKFEGQFWLIDTLFGSLTENSSAIDQYKIEPIAVIQAIDRHQVVSDWQKLIPGLKRITTMYFFDSRLNRRIRSGTSDFDIDNSEFVQRAKNLDTEFYEKIKLIQYFHKERWRDIFSLLKSTDYLSNSLTLKLVERLVDPAAEILITEVDSQFYQKNKVWWLNFLTSSICFGGHDKHQFELEIKLGVFINCSAEMGAFNNISVAEPDKLESLLTLMSPLLLKSTLSVQDISTFLETLHTVEFKNQMPYASPYQFLEYWARINKLKSVFKRSDKLFQIDANYKALVGASLTAGFIKPDGSFWSYYGLLHWFKEGLYPPKERRYKSVLQLLQVSSAEVHTIIAEQLPMHVILGNILEQDWPAFLALTDYLSATDKAVLNALLFHEGWAGTFNPESDVAFDAQASKYQAELASAHYFFSIVGLIRRANSFEELVTEYRNYALGLLNSEHLSTIEQRSGPIFDDNQNLTHNTLRDLEKIYTELHP